MNISFVIDYQQHKVADVLNSFLKENKRLALNIATAYFNAGEQR